VRFRFLALAFVLCLLVSSSPSLAGSNDKEVTELLTGTLADESSVTSNPDAALETLAIIAYHQPVTRAEIEEIRGVSTSPGTLDVLMECEWIRPRGRRRAPGRPLTFGTTETFLAHFGLASIKDLPGLADLKSSGLLDANLPPDFKVPEPTDVAALMPDELPLTDDGVEDETEDGQQDELPLHDEDGTANPDQGGAEAPPETEGA